MSSAAPPPPPLRPSVFISYASEDRAAARSLRDLLSAAGLEVWYDEAELGGGDAWDQKIRRQIRDCDYFMPIVSATTNRRKEGYFRREWRLAAERTLDMADDVLFLLPVTIDDTPELGARVPEKFFTVQWLRAPGGQRIPALDALIQRLLAGDHTPLTRPPLLLRPKNDYTMPPMAPPPPPEDNGAPPPMPAFPHAPEAGGFGHWLRYFAEIAWWVISATWLLFTRLPKWLRIILALWLVLTLISTCGRDSSPNPRSRGPKEPRPPSSEEIHRAVRTAAEEVAAALKKEGKAADGKGPEYGRRGEEIVRRFAKAMLDPNAAGKRLVLVPFEGGADAAAAKWVQSVFTAASEGILGARRPESVVTRINVGGAQEPLTALGRALGAAFTLGGQVTTTGPEPTLIVRLVKSSDGSVAWTSTYPVSAGDPVVLGARIAEEAVKHVPPRNANREPR